MPLSAYTSSHSDQVGEERMDPVLRGGKGLLILLTTLGPVHGTGWWRREEQMSSNGPQPKGLPGFLICSRQIPANPI